MKNSKFGVIIYALKFCTIKSPSGREGSLRRIKIMISAGEFRNGVTFDMDGKVMQVVEFQHVKPGKGAAFVRVKMKNVITGAGYGEYFGHGYGHSLGLEIHEAPNLNPSNTQPMPAGAVCSAEPGIYLPGKFGVRIEDVTFLSENGCEDITKSPKNLIIVK